MNLAGSTVETVQPRYTFHAAGNHPVCPATFVSLFLRWPFNASKTGQDSGYIHHLNLA